MEVGEHDEPETELAEDEEESVDDIDEGRNVALVDRTLPMLTALSTLSPTKNDVGNAFGGGNDLGQMLLEASLALRIPGLPFS